MASRTAPTGTSNSRATSSGDIGSAQAYQPYSTRARIRVPLTKSCRYVDFGFGTRNSYAVEALLMSSMISPGLRAYNAVSVVDLAGLWTYASSQNTVRQASHWPRR